MASFSENLNNHPTEINGVKFVAPKVSLLGYTQLNPGVLDIMEFDDNATEAETLVEFAGRSCYDSYHKPNPATRKNADYITSTVVDKKHYSITEHAHATLYFTGVSRAFTHELIRHRHLEYSQRSQRFVNESETQFILPPLYRGADAKTLEPLTDSFKQALAAYEPMVEKYMEAGATRKEAREAARSVLPNATETRIVVTGNVRAWREVIDRRTAPDADQEIQEVMRLADEALAPFFPTLFGSNKIVK